MEVSSLAEEQLHGSKHDEPPSQLQMTAVISSPKRAGPLGMPIACTVAYTLQNIATSCYEPVHKLSVFDSRNAHVSWVYASVQS